MNSTTTKAFQIRWLLRRDMDAILAIEQVSFQWPWTEREFRARLRNPKIVGMVTVDSNNEPIGYMIYKVYKNRIRLLNIAVAPRYRRQGIGRAMVEKLKEKLIVQQRRFLLVNVWERNLCAQLFFRAAGLKAVKVLRGYYDYDGVRDAYRMRLECEELKPTKTGVT